MKTGWILQTEYNEFVDEDLDTTDVIEDAEVFSTRKKAREAVASYNMDDVVRKVEVDENGIAVKIIPGR